MTHAERIRRHARPLDPIPASLGAKLSPLLRIKSVVFDIYGTLIISGTGDIGLVAEASKDEAMADSFRALGIAPPAGGLAERFDALIRAAQDRRRQDGIEYPEVEIREVWRTLAGEAVPDALIEPLAIEYECRTNPVWPMPHLAESLADLRARDLRLGIVSNAQFYTPHLFPALLGESLEALGFAPDDQIYSYELREGKPSTALYERLAARFDPAATLYIGNDLLKDIWAAQRTGFRTALFAGDARSLRLREGDPRVAGTTPDIVATDLRQIADCLVAPR